MLERARHAAGAANPRVPGSRSVKDNDQQQTPHPVIETIRDSGEYNDIRVLCYSWYTGWGPSTTAALLRY